MTARRRADDLVDCEDGNPRGVRLSTAALLAGLKDADAVGDWGEPVTAGSAAKTT
jgi:hypothetical protein